MNTPDHRFALNALFGFLTKLEQQHDNGKYAISLEGGSLIGSVTMQQGRVCKIISRNSFQHLLELFSTQAPDSHQELSTLASHALKQGENVWRVLTEANQLDTEKLQFFHRMHTATEAQAIVSDCGRSAPVFSQMGDRARPIASDENFSCLELLTAVTQPSKVQPSDLAMQVFEQCGADSELAILMLRPKLPEMMPIPLAVHGTFPRLEGEVHESSLEMATMFCQSARELLQQSTLQEMQSIHFSTNEGSWTAVMGTHSIVFLRSPSPRHLARLISKFKNARERLALADSPVSVITK